MNIQDIRNLKRKRKISSVTVLDTPTAKWATDAEIDIALVGDSLGMVSLGLKDTTYVTMPSMIQAVEASRRGFGDSTKTLLVADLPLEGLQNPIESSRKLIDAGADAVKIECHEQGKPIVKKIIQSGIEVMAHVGLLPQEIERLGGYKLQGKDEESAARIVETAKEAEADGCFSCVIEKVPTGLAKRITDALTIPTIGIGAGSDCDGQILVLYDLLGIFDEFRPKFVRRFASLSEDAVAALREYKSEVEKGGFPSMNESYK